MTSILEQLIAAFRNEQRQEATRQMTPAETGYDGKARQLRRRRNKMARASRKRNR